MPAKALRCSGARGFPPDEGAEIAHVGAAGEQVEADSALLPMGRQVSFRLDEAEEQLAQPRAEQRGGTMAPPHHPENSRDQIGHVRL